MSIRQYGVTNVDNTIMRVFLVSTCINIVTLYPYEVIYLAEVIISRCYVKLSWNRSFSVGYQKSSGAWTRNTCTTEREEKRGGEGEEGNESRRWPSGGFIGGKCSWVSFSSANTSSTDSQNTSCTAYSINWCQLSVPFTEQHKAEQHGRVYWFSHRGVLGGCKAWKMLMAVLC